MLSNIHDHVLDCFVMILVYCRGPVRSIEYATKLCGSCEQCEQCVMCQQCVLCEHCECSSLLGISEYELTLVTSSVIIGNSDVRRHRVDGVGC